MGNPWGENMPQMQTVGERKARHIRVEFEAWYRRSYDDFRGMFDVDTAGVYESHDVFHSWVAFKGGWALCEVARAGR